MSDIPEPTPAVNGPNSDIPLIERAAVVLLNRFGQRLLTGTGDSLPEAVDDVRLILDAALDAELIARVLAQHTGLEIEDDMTTVYCVSCDTDLSEDYLWDVEGGPDQNLALGRHQAEAVRAALLGGNR